VKTISVVGEESGLWEKIECYKEWWCVFCEGEFFFSKCKSEPNEEKRNI